MGTSAVPCGELFFGVDSEHASYATGEHAAGQHDEGAQAKMNI